MNTYTVEYTDTFAGEANYSWLRRATVEMPESWHRFHKGVIDDSWIKAQKAYSRELMRKAKAAVGLTGVRGVKHSMGGVIEFRPYGSATVMFITFKD